MQKIALIASDKRLFHDSKAIVQELGMQDQVIMYYARLKKAVQLARQLKDEEIDVIIARGAAAQLIPDAGIRIPVINIVVTGQDLAFMFQEAKAISGLNNPKVAFIAFSNIAPDLEALSEIFGFNVTVFRVKRQEDIPFIVNKVVNDNFDVLISGKSTVRSAQPYNIKCLLIHSGDMSIKTALLEAEKVSLGRKIEKENAQKFKVLVEHALEGIISIGCDKIIRVFNSAAGQLLRYPVQDAIGKEIGELIDLPIIDSCLVDGKQALSQVQQCGNNWLNINIAPIIVDERTIGAFITLQDISRIQEAEAKIRHEVLVRKFTAKYIFSDILGSSSEILETKRIALEFAKANATTLIIGQSGTGKELFAQSIHNNSSRKNGPFVAVNCAALPPNLLESELFGYVEGAFTGAIKKGKQGLFEMAHNGTLFLDEISEMDLYGQIRLLRVLQEKQVMRLGGDKYIPVDVRVIAATNKSLTELINSGKFRQDLYYRLQVLVLKLPPLAHRKGDIKLLADHFLRYYNLCYQKQLTLAEESYRCLMEYSWPGNVRELMHFIERLVVLANHAVISLENLKTQFMNDEMTADFSVQSSISEPNEAYVINAALEASNYNIKLTANSLGIARSTLYRKLKSYNIQMKKTY